jgi:Family of unknown function (DUF6496)
MANTKSGPRSRKSERSSSKPGRRSKTKSTMRATSSRYGKKASEKVERAMHEMKRGTLRSGRSGKKVTDRQQAIAIGLSEARRAGGKVPRQESTRNPR